MIYLLRRVLSVGPHGSFGMTTACAVMFLSCIDVPQPPSPQMVIDILSAIAVNSRASLGDIVNGSIATRERPGSTPHTIYHQIQRDLRQSCSISSRARCISTSPRVHSVYVKALPAP